MSFRNVRILYSSLCPGHKETLRLAIDAADSLGVDAAIEQIDVETQADATRLRFLGSPTVQIEGKDVEPAARIRTDFGIGVRYYTGGVNHPSMKLLRDALAAVDNERMGPLCEHRQTGVASRIVD
jgi:hypothetical protein